MGNNDNIIHGELSDGKKITLTRAFPYLSMTMNIDITRIVFK